MTAEATETRTAEELDAEALVIEARRAGRAWADREAEIAHMVAGEWISTERDALALVDCAHDDHAAGECPLAAAASCAAAARWDELAGEETGPPVSRTEMDVPLCPAHFREAREIDRKARS